MSRDLTRYHTYLNLWKRTMDWRRDFFPLRHIACRAADNTQSVVPGNRLPWAKEWGTGHLGRSPQTPYAAPKQRERTTGHTRRRAACAVQGLRTGSVDAPVVAGNRDHDDDSQGDQALGGCKCFNCVAPSSS